MTLINLFVLFLFNVLVFKYKQYKVLFLLNVLVLSIQQYCLNLDSVLIMNIPTCISINLYLKLNILLQNTLSFNLIYENLMSFMYLTPDKLVPEELRCGHLWKCKANLFNSHGFRYMIFFSV